MARKVGNEILTKKQYDEQVKKFCKHLRKKMKRK